MGSGVSAAAGSVPPVEVYRWDPETSRPVLARDAGAPPTPDPVVNSAYDNAVQVARFYGEQLGRSGHDGKGSTIKLNVHAPVANAEWDSGGQQLWFSDGDDETAPYAHSLDVVAHEFTHGVVDAEVRLSFGGQGGALHESWADVMAVAVDAEDWQIGEDIVTPGVEGGAVRDLSVPAFGHVRDVPEGFDDAHTLSSVPSFAAYTVGTRVGREAMGKIWYRGLSEHLSNGSGFSGAARATITAAAELYGSSSKEYAAVNDAWKAVGVDPRFRGEHRERLAAADARFGAALTT